MPCCTVRQPLLLPTSLGPASLAPVAPLVPLALSLRPLATVNSQTPGRGKGCTLTSRGSVGIYMDVLGVALHIPSPKGPSRQVREGRPARDPASPEPRVRAEPGHRAPTPQATPWRRLPPPRTPVSGARTPSTAPPWAATSSRG